MRKTTPKTRFVGPARLVRGAPRALQLSKTIEFRQFRQFRQISTFKIWVSAFHKPISPRTLYWFRQKQHRAVHRPTLKTVMQCGETRVFPSRRNRLRPKCNSTIITVSLHYTVKLRCVTQNVKRRAKYCITGIRINITPSKTVRPAPMIGRKSYSSQVHSIYTIQQVMRPIFSQTSAAYMGSCALISRGGSSTDKNKFNKFK
jgi:hypothetical protein